MPQHPVPPRWPLLVLRVCAALVALLAATQPFLAGGFLQGYYPLLDAHLMAAMILATVVLLAVLAAAVVRWFAGGPVRFVVTFGVLLISCVAQISLGFERALLLHIPLGVGIFVMAEKFAVDVFTFKPGSAPAAEKAAETVGAQA